MPVPVTIQPVAEREVYIVKETSPGVIPAGVGSPVPVTTFKPSDKPIWIKDESMQGSMGDNYGIYQGPLIAALDVGGHVTGDQIGHFLYNLLGDYTVTGTTAAPNATTNAITPVGQLFLTVVSGGASFTNGMAVWIQDAGSPAANEVVLVGSGSTATNIVLTTPTRFAHANSTPVTNTTAPYTHVFSLLNGSVGAANGPAQGPTHTITDRQGLTANGAAQYAYCALSEIVLTGNSEKLLDWTGKVVCFTRAAAASAVGTANVSTVNPYPAWRSTVGVGSPATYAYTATSASPCVFTAAGSAFTNGTALYLDPGGLPTGFSPGLTYYVVAAAGATFSLALTAGGTAINSSSTGAGFLAVQRREIAEWEITLSRQVKPYNTAQGAQTPYVIARGKQNVAGKITVAPAIDESWLGALLANTQPQAQFLAANGLTGANLVSVQADVALAAYVTADLDDSAELFGYSVPFDAAHTAATTGGLTMTGASGGKGAAKITLVNAVPSY